MLSPDAHCERSAEFSPQTGVRGGAFRAMFTPRLWVRPPAQFFCYLVGAYLGFLAASSAETLLRSPRHSSLETEIPFELMALLYVPATVFMSVPFAAAQ